jgi:hypothetical protein
MNFANDLNDCEPSWYRASARCSPPVPQKCRNPRLPTSSHAPRTGHIEVQSGALIKIMYATDSPRKRLPHNPLHPNRSETAGRSLHDPRTMPNPFQSR